MPIKFYCIKCGQRLSIASKNAGKSIPCPACHNEITIPHTSEPRRTDSAKGTPESQPDSISHPEPEADLREEENQLFDDIDNFAALGDSWDEILVEDSKDATEDTDQPAVETQTHEEEEIPEHTEPELPPQTITAEQEVLQAAPVPEEASIVETIPAETETETARQHEQTAPPETQVAFQADLESDDDDDDDDDGFQIRSAESEFDEMDLTPMVDVTFLLLIFFMITASFSLQKSIQVPPPNPDEDGVSQSLQTLDDFREESIIVEIDNNNGIYVDDTKLSNPSEIAQAILDRRNQDGKTKSELVLSAHNAARHETVVAVVDAANEVGMQKIRLASYRGPED